MRFCLVGWFGYGLGFFLLVLVSDKFIRVFFNFVNLMIVG